MNDLSQVLVNALIAGSLYGLITIGFNLIYGTVNFFDLAYGSVLVIGGYMVYLFLRIMNLPQFFAVGAAIIVCALFGLFIYRIVYRRLEKKKASNMVYLVASLGVFTVVQAIIALFFSNEFQTISPGPQHAITIGNIVITDIQLITVVSLFVIATVISLILKYSRLGKAIRAVSDDPEVSKIVGINTKQIISWVFIIGSAVGGIAGILSAYDSGVQPTIGFSLLLKGIIAAIIGGVGELWAGVAGALILALIENIGIWQLSAEWKDGIAFSVLILFLLFRPRGIFKK